MDVEYEHLYSESKDCLHTALAQFVHRIVQT